MAVALLALLLCATGAQGQVRGDGTLRTDGWEVAVALDPAVPVYNAQTTLRLDVSRLGNGTPLPLPADLSVRLYLFGPDTPVPNATSDLTETDEVPLREGSTTQRWQGRGTFDRPGRWVIVVTLNETMLVGMVDVGQGEGAELVLAGVVLGIVGPVVGIFVWARWRGRGRERLLQQRGTRAERRSHPSAGRGGDHDQE